MDSAPLMGVAQHAGGDAVDIQPSSRGDVAVDRLQVRRRQPLDRETADTRDDVLAQQLRVPLIRLCRRGSVQPNLQATSLQRRRLILYWDRRIGR